MYPISTICKVTDPNAKRLIDMLYRRDEEREKEMLSIRSELEEMKLRKGVPSLLREMGMRTKPPDNIA